MVVGPPSRKKNITNKAKQPGGRYRFFHGEKRLLEPKFMGLSIGVLLFYYPRYQAVKSYIGSQNSSCSGPSVLPKVAVQKDGPKVSAMITATSEALEGC